MSEATSESKDFSVQRVREDSRTLRRAIVRLGMPFLVRRLALLVIGVVVYLLLARAILGFGEDVSYARLGPPEAAVVSFLTRINMYIWWGVVVLLGLITFFTLKSAWHASVLRERAVPVAAEDLRRLAASLSDPVLGVMRWVWSDHSDPLTIGDLQRTLAETRSGRIGKINLALQQESTLGIRAAPQGAT